MARLRFLGTGSGTPDPDRMTSALLVEGPNGALLLDAGEGCARRLQEADAWRQEVRSILLTHNHGDHVAGLPMLFMAWKAQGRTTPLELVSPAGLGDAAVEWLSHIRLGLDRLPFGVILRDLAEGPQDFASGHRGAAWLNDHIPLEEGGSYCVDLELEGGRWIFSSDLASLAPLEGRMKGAAGLVVESKHVDPVEATDLARQAGVATVILTHIPPGSAMVPVEGATWAYENMVIETGTTGE